MFNSSLINDMIVFASEWKKVSDRLGSSSSSRVHQPITTKPTSYHRWIHSPKHYRLLFFICIICVSIDLVSMSFILCDLAKKEVSHTAVQIFSVMSIIILIAAPSIVIAYYAGN